MIKIKGIGMRNIADLIYTMALNKASEEELDRVIKYSRDFIDYINDRKDFAGITESYNSNNVLELITKYHPFLEDKHD